MSRWADSRSFWLQHIQWQVRAFCWYYWLWTKRTSMPVSGFIFMEHFQTLMSVKSTLFLLQMKSEFRSDSEKCIYDENLNKNWRSTATMAGNLIYPSFNRLLGANGAGVNFVLGPNEDGGSPESSSRLWLLPLLPREDAHYFRTSARGCLSGTFDQFFWRRRPRLLT